VAQSASQNLNRAQSAAAARAECPSRAGSRRSPGHNLRQCPLARSVGSQAGSPLSPWRCISLRPWPRRRSRPHEEHQRLGSKSVPSMSTGKLRPTVLRTCPRKVIRPNGSAIVRIASCILPTGRQRPSSCRSFPSPAASSRRLVMRRSRQHIAWFGTRLGHARLLHSPEDCLRNRNLQTAVC
jgi:hypothetical protein